MAPPDRPDMLDQPNLPDLSGPCSVPRRRAALSSPSARAAVALGVAGATLAGAAMPAGAETYLTGSCMVSSRGLDNVLRFRTFQARINGAIEQGTGRYVWSSYDYSYHVDPGLVFGPQSDERVTVTEGYVNGLANPWQSPDSHGTNGGWLSEGNWKGIRSNWGSTRVQFQAAFDVPRTSDPHCTTTTARV